MKANTNNLSRAEKILVFLYEFGKGRTVKVRYEDIVVGVFKKYPQDFHLKGYKEYPDTGDLIHKPLYDFKKKGYVNAVSKVFSLTDRGIEYAKQLTIGKVDIVHSGDRLSRSASTEVVRIKSLEGFLLFMKGDSNQLSENDFYNYFGVTVRTPKNAFIGRFETMKALVSELKEQDDQLYKSITEYHDFLVEKYKNIITFFTNN